MNSRCSNCVGIRIPGNPMGGGKGDPSKPVVGIAQSGGSMGHMVVVPDNRGSLDLFDDGFTSNGVGLGYGVGFDHIVRGRHFNDFFNMFDDIIRNIIRFLNMYRLIDSMNFFLDSNDGSGNRLGSF